MNLQKLLKWPLHKFLAIWLIGLAVLSLYSFPLFIPLRSHLPFLGMMIQHRETASIALYDSRSTPPLVIGGIKNPTEAYLHLRFSFRFEKLDDHPNLFQTAPLNRGARMELSGTNAAIVIRDPSVQNEVRAMALSTQFQPERWYSIDVEILNGGFIRAQVDGGQYVLHNDPSFQLETSQLMVGGGFDGSRDFHGMIKDISFSTGQFPTNLLSSLFDFIFVFGLIIIVVKIYLSRKLLVAEFQVTFENLKKKDWIQILSILLILVFGLTMFTAYHFPVFSDEVNIRFLHSRMIYDFPMRLSGTPRCISTYTQPMLWTTYWPGLINWGIHGSIESPTSMRQIGVVIALLWILGLLYYLRSKTKKPLSMVGFVISLFSIGVFPIFLVLNRSEQLLVPSVVLLIFAFLASEHLTSKTWQKKMGLTALYFTAVSLILFGHAKGLFLIPLFLVVGWKLFSQFTSRVPLIAASIFLTIQIVQSYSVWKFGYSCPEMPGFEAWQKSFSLDPFSLFTQPGAFFEGAFRSFIRSSEYLHHLGFNEATEWNYLETKPLSNLSRTLNSFLILNVTILFLYLLICLPLRYRQDLLQGQKININLALFTLFSCTVISGIFNIPKHWYDAGYLYALLAVTLVFFLSENYLITFQSTHFRKIKIFIFIVAILSQSIFVCRNLPSLLNGYAGPGIQIGKFEIDEAQKDLVELSRICNIDPNHSKRLVVDGFTAGHFRKSQFPMPINYITLDSDDRLIREFFSKVESEGLVTFCSSVPENYRAFLKRSGQYCCLSKEALRKTFSPQDKGIRKQ